MYLYGSDFATGLEVETKPRKNKQTKHNNIMKTFLIFGRKQILKTTTTTKTNQTKQKKNVLQSSILCRGEGRVVVMAVYVVGPLHLSNNLAKKNKTKQNKNQKTE